MLLKRRPIGEKSGKIIGHRARFGGIHPSIMGFWRDFGEMLSNNSAIFRHIHHLIPPRMELMAEL